jgi:hypothetical protein
MSRTPSPGEQEMGKGRRGSTTTTYWIHINAFFVSTRVDADDVGSQNILGMQEKTIDLHYGGGKAPY